jgi:hypothetical protein
VLQIIVICKNGGFAAGWVPVSPGVAASLFIDAALPPPLCEDDSPGLQNSPEPGTLTLCC